MEPKWLEWIKRLQAISQIGLTFTKDPYDIERYEEIRKIAADMLANKTGIDEEAVLDLFSRESDYATPKVDVRGVVFKDDKILLVKETSDNRWAIPGGWADIGESPRESVEREVYEESGYIVKANRLLAVYDRSKHPHKPLFQYHIYKMFFLCELVGGQATTSIETSEIDFFDEDNLPELSIGKVLPDQITHFFQCYRNPDLPVYFD